MAAGFTSYTGWWVGGFSLQYQASVSSLRISRTTIVISQRTFGHKCERRDIRMHQGSTWRRPIALVDYLGVAVDLTGCTLRGNVRKNALDAGTPLITIACTITDAASGYAELLVTNTVLAAITTGERLKDTASRHWYDVELEWSDGYVQRIVEGRDDIFREVTK